jgi:hypothetical protein
MGSTEMSAIDTDTQVSVEDEQDIDPHHTSTIDATVNDLLAACPPEKATERDFLGAQFDHGLAWVNFPPGCGGLGLPAGAQRHANLPRRGRRP